MLTRLQPKCLIPAYLFSIQCDNIPSAANSIIKFPHRLLVNRINHFSSRSSQCINYKHQLCQTHTPLLFWIKITSAPALKDFTSNCTYAYKKDILTSAKEFSLQKIRSNIMSRHQELVKLFHKLLHSDFFLKSKQNKTKQTKNPTKI